MTQVTIIGNISEPELRFTNSGIPVLTFSIASTKRVKGADGQWTDGATSWRKVTAWRGLAEGLGDQLSKGKRVIVVGDEEVREYETQDGKKGVSVDVTAEHVGLYLFPQRRGGGQGASGADSWATTAPANPEPSGGGFNPNAETPF